MLSGTSQYNEPFRRRLAALLSSLTVFAAMGTVPADAQLAPGIGYMFPPGGRPGETIDVVLGGYDWTPDIQLFARLPGARFEISGPPGPVIVPEPPYWFGKKARRPPFLLPRETPARLTIPSGIAPGVYSWQVANANGASATGRFLVTEHPHFIEPVEERTVAGTRNTTVRLPPLPVSVSGQIRHIEEVDRYEFSVSRADTVTITAQSRVLNSPLNTVLEVRTTDGQLIADAADTAGQDISLTFTADPDQKYSLSVFDLDFRGNRSFVYQITLTTGPRVLATVPAAGQRGQAQPVEFTGYGLIDSSPQLQTVTRTIRFPADSDLDTFVYALETPAGGTTTVRFPLSDHAEVPESATSGPLTLPAGVTGILEQRYGEDRFIAEGNKGDVWNISVASARLASPLDVALAVFDATGKELARSDDESGSTDASVEFRLPDDGQYQIAVTDTSRHSGDRSAAYRLQIKPAQPGARAILPEFLNAPIAATTRLPVKIVRRAGFSSPVRILVDGLPDGVTIPETLEVPEKKNSLNIEFTVAGNAAAAASLITVRGEAISADASTDAGVTPLFSEPLLLATTITPPFSIDAEGKDDVAKWPRGTTFPYPVLIERDESFQGEIVLEMTSRQGRHRQGIHGPELAVPPGVDRILYPIFLPEWLETTRTSRMVVNGVAQIPDPQGNVRYSVVRQKTRMGFLPTGALLKLSARDRELPAVPGRSLTIPLSLSRSPKLREPAVIRLLPNAFGFHAEPLTVASTQHEVELQVTVPQSLTAGTECPLTVQATVLKEGHLRTVSETSVLAIGTPQVAGTPQ